MYFTKNILENNKTQWNISEGGFTYRQIKYNTSIISKPLKSIDLTWLKVYKVVGIVC